MFYDGTMKKKKKLLYKGTIIYICIFCKDIFITVIFFFFSKEKKTAILFSIRRYKMYYVQRKKNVTILRGQFPALFFF